MFVPHRLFILWTETEPNSKEGTCEIYLKGRLVEKVYNKKSPNEVLTYDYLPELVKKEGRKTGVKPPCATRFCLNSV